ncbi:MAG: hypothetical protein GY870_21960 [archaeon]|nr:hypothetical protein [archaeon]
MVKRKRQKITSDFGYRYRLGKREFHKGIDLRTWNLKTYFQQDIIFPERCEVLELVNSHKWGKGLWVKPLESGYKKLYLLHVNVNKNIKEGNVYEKGDFIGKSMITWYMKQHHLHFETYKEKIADPKNYLAFIGYEYD